MRNAMSPSSGLGTCSERPGANPCPLRRDSPHLRPAPGLQLPCPQARVGRAASVKMAHQWRARARLDRKALMPMWRYAVITLLREAARAGVLDSGHVSQRAAADLLTAQYERWWNIDVKRFKSSKAVPGIRRSAMPGGRPSHSTGLRTIRRQEIRFEDEGHPHQTYRRDRRIRRRS